MSKQIGLVPPFRYRLPEKLQINFNRHRKYKQNSIRPTNKTWATSAEYKLLYLWISNQIKKRKKERKRRYHMPREKQFDFDVETKFGAT